MDSFSFPSGPAEHVGLRELAHKCLNEPPSRRLDGEIYCAIHNIEDANLLITPGLVEAKEAGEVLVEHRPGAGLAWVEAPPFTTQLKYAESLLPDGLLTIHRNASVVCATALLARVLANEPALPVSETVDCTRPALPFTFG
jgi:hypothetical protein